MQIVIAAVGKLGRTAEQALAQTYAERATANGRSLRLGPVRIIEVEAKKPGKAAEAEALAPALADGHVIACDEHGSEMSSRELAERLTALRDQGQRRLVFVIGGPDGLAASVLRHARERLSFGRQTWPHALARLMLAEQVYRATTIMAGQPYHRD
ncbi:MAG TPA: 23S rRNA (pseudouridine(1915)-N(3))-methyltransferase RlmH [Caulobacteraceae bacterium]|nr:23S rRNA (pseudouridine(1915)-N(3))-methyltransferase RlmH [Caulobacteraceae bacterium]